MAHREYSAVKCCLGESFSEFISTVTYSLPWYWRALLSYIQPKCECLPFPSKSIVYPNEPDAIPARRKKLESVSPSEAPVSLRIKLSTSTDFFNCVKPAESLSEMNSDPQYEDWSWCTSSRQSHPISRWLSICHRGSNCTTIKIKSD